MAKPFSMDLRERIVRAVLAGKSRHEAARAFDVSPSCVIKLMQRYQATGGVGRRSLAAINGPPWLITKPRCAPSSPRAPT
jgi:transposase